jgi:uncharacterized protein YjbJ (UPF0337 family)
VENREFKILNKGEKMSQEIREGKWKELKGELQKAWGRITDDEWEKTKGDMKSVSGLIQQRYGQGKEDVSDKVSDIYEKYVSKPMKKMLRDDKH